MDHDEEAALEDAAGELLAAGPLTERQLLAALRRQGFRITPEDFEDLWLADRSFPGVVQLGRRPSILLRADLLLHGRIFTHRLTAQEIADHRILLDDDLEACLLMNEGDGVCLLDGEPMHTTFVRETLEIFLPLPDGSLRGRTAGQLIGIRVLPDGYHLEFVDEAGSYPPALMSTVHSHLSSGDSGLSMDLIFRFCLDHPDLFTTPLPPLSESWEGWGVVVRGSSIATVGSPAAQRMLRNSGRDAPTAGPTIDDANGEPVDHRDRGTDTPASAIAETYGLSILESLRVTELLAVLEEFHAVVHPATDDPVPEQTAEELLDDPATAALVAIVYDQAAAIAVFDEFTNHAPHEAQVLQVAAQHWESRTRGSAKAGWAWIVGRCADIDNDVEAAAAAFGRALALDPRHHMSIYAQARLASERGDAVTALSLLHRTGLPPTDNLYAMMERFQPQVRTDIGRNAPCPCGSGRKYKVCHARQAGYPLQDRVDWLYQKVALWAQDSAAMQLIEELAEVRSAFQSGTDAMGKALNDPCVLDVALFDGGYLAAYLRARGHLLPDDEDLLATSWLTVERSLYEVEDNRPGVGFTLRDLRTGERHEVLEQSGSRQARNGMYLSVRLLSGEGPPSINSGIEPVPDHLRDATLAVLDRQNTEEADEFEMIRILSARFAPPTLTAVGGEPLIFCTAHLKVAAGKTLARKLTAAFGPSDGGEWPSWTWTEPMDPDHPDLGERVLGTVEQSFLPGRWKAEANTESRFEELLAKVLEFAPTSKVLQEKRLTPDQVPATTPAAHPDQNDPALQAMLEQFTLGFEKRWLDDAIPALGGLTPRQAAADPTRRPELIRLLDSLDGFSRQPGAMNADRLRAALGL